VKLFHFNTRNCQQCLKGAAVVVFLATPGSMLLLPLLAWWKMRDKGKGQRPLNAGLRFSMNAVRPSV
jgi:hypothetical protein